MQAETFLAGRPVAAAVYDRVLEALEELGPVTVEPPRAGRLPPVRGFAFLWVPGQYARPQADVVLSQHRPPRRVTAVKEVNHPSARHWIHHLGSTGPTTSMTR